MTAARDPSSGQRHPLPLDRVRGLLSETRGLATAEVTERRARHGANHIVEATGHPAAELARDTARDPMIWFLVGTSILYFTLGQTTEAITLLVSLVPLVGMDVYLHARTQASTSALRGKLASTARVARDGAELTIPATEIVVGDLALVATGEPFPADGVIVGGTELRVDESSLSGEAFPVEKRLLAVEPRGGPEPLVDNLHWGFAGTRLLTGEARVRIAAIGAETLYGAIVQMSTGATHERTPLQRAIGGLVTALLVIAAGLCAILAIVRLRQGYGWADALVNAATLAVAALPEEFPVVLTVFLGVGVYRLARRKALVRRAVAVENIGRVSWICSDKTGTITEGQLRVARVDPASGVDDARVLSVAAAASRLETGDPLDRAILDATQGRPPGEVLATFPFTEDRRRETAVVRDADRLTAFTKGAPETVLAMCSDDDLAAWTARITALAEAGHKVIACASRALKDDYAGGEPDRGYQMTGLIGIADPVREGVVDSVAWCRAAGVRVLMVTGDHPMTARAVAREMGLADQPSVVTGAELAAAADVGAAVAAADVVARAMPAQKLAIVRALQQAGEIVAVTGDGVNDVPALQAADVGIAMGQRGARSAREVSAIVLLDDNFRSIVAAIAEGRALFDNLRSSFQYLLMIHLPLVLTATLVPLGGDPVLYLPIHIVWLEAIIHPTAMLAFQRPSGGRGVVSRARGRDARLFSRGETAVIVAVGGLITLVVLGTYERSLAAVDVEHARAMAMVALTVASGSVTAVLSGLRTRAAQVVVVVSLVAAALLVQIPALAALLHLRPLHVDDWLLAIGGGVVAVVPAAVLAHVRRRPTPEIT